MQMNPKGGERDHIWACDFCRIRRKLLVCTFSLRTRAVAFGSLLSASCQHHRILSILFILCIFVSYYIDPANGRGTLPQLVQFLETTKVLLPASIPCMQKNGRASPRRNHLMSYHMPQLFLVVPSSQKQPLTSQRQQRYTNQSSSPGAPELELAFSSVSA